METLTEGYGLIEAPVWDGDRLLFSDVVFGGVFSVTSDGDTSVVFEHRKGIGGMSLHAEGGWIVSGRNIAHKPVDGGSSVTILDKNAGAGLVGFNDLTTDSKGRIYAGGLGGNPLSNEGGPPRASHLFLIDLEGAASTVAGDVQLTNGLGFSPDGNTLYHSDSARRMVMKYDVNNDGSLGEKTPFVRTDTGCARWTGGFRRWRRVGRAGGKRPRRSGVQLRRYVPRTHRDSGSDVHQRVLRRPRPP